MIRSLTSHIPKVIFVAICLITPCFAFAQVSDVNDNLEKSKNKENSAEMSATTSENSSGGGFILFLGDVFMATIGAAQQGALANRHIYPERISFIADLDYGLGFENNSRNLSTSARINWGILATDFRYNSLSDDTGILNTVDWQIVVLRIPIKSFNLEYGFGIIGIPNQNQSFNSNAIGFDFKLRPIGLSIGSHYYWSSRSSLNTRFRKSFEILGDYEFVTNNKFHLSAIAKYSFQQYFEQTNFSIISAGLAIKFY